MRHSLIRLLRQAGAALLATSLLLPSAQADAWPSRPLKLIVPFPPGGAADAVGRIYAEKLAALLKQPVLVDNKPGAGSAIGGDIVAKAAPDGYTLSLAPAGKLRTLAITSQERSPLLPDVPTVAEAGYAQAVSTSWFGLVLPAGTPQPIIDRLAGALATIARQPELRDRLAQLGLDTLNSTPSQFAALIRADRAKWGGLIQRAGIRGD